MKVHGALEAIRPCNRWRAKNNKLVKQCGADHRTCDVLGSVTVQSVIYLADAITSIPSSLDKNYVSTIPDIKPSYFVSHPVGY